MKQEIEKIDVSKLVLWTENPRDPISKTAKDQDIVDKAVEDRSSKWNLKKLAKSMGEFYDFSELPTVVYHGKVPVVYDGNRRVIIAKIIHGLVTTGTMKFDQLPQVPIEIPCNVCDKKTALANVLRKHGDSGSWKTLEREIFLHKFMGEQKSPFLVIAEDTGILEEYPKMNQRFVKEELFKDENLKSLGFDVKKGRLVSRHKKDEAELILGDVGRKVTDNVISTRNSRGKLLEVLEPATRRLIRTNESEAFKPSAVKFGKPATTSVRLTKRKGKTDEEIFGGKLDLEKSDTNDLYRDISDFYAYYVRNKKHLSESFPSLIRMSLRLLAEAAASESNKSMESYLKGHFDAAKKQLTKDQKTSLSNLNVKKDSLTQLLHTGAHSYKASSNLDQTMAVALILGKIIYRSHGKRQ
jgi:hypothetical protein